MEETSPNNKSNSNLDNRSTQQTNQTNPIIDKSTSDSSTVEHPDRLYLHPKEYNLDWYDVTIDVPNRNLEYSEKYKRVLVNASGELRNGLHAIMGPSGSGKTSLLNALVGRIPPGSKTFGEITINDAERNEETWPRITGYVDQDDTIYQELTAYDTLYYAAKFRLNSLNVTIPEQIDKVARKLGILHILQNKMKKLSGGERKRVMIAVELVTDPKILFLDEPTSGLFNTSALRLIKFLKSLAKKGKLIVLTIHQPDDKIIAQIDSLVLLTEGRTAYMGKFSDCQYYLERNGFKREKDETFSGFLMRVLDTSEDTIDLQSDQNKKSDDSKSEQQDENFEGKKENKNDEGNKKSSKENKEKKLNLLVQDVNETFLKGLDLSNEPKQKKHNEIYFSTRLNVFHITTLLARRFKLLFFTYKSLLTLFFMCLWMVFMILTAENLKRQTHLSGTTICTGLSTDISIDAISAEEKQKYELSELYRHIFVSLCHFPISLVPVTAASAFSTEFLQVKREIGVNTYSALSYYISVLIYELILALIPISILFSGLLYVFKDLPITIFDFWFNFYNLWGNVVFYLFSGSIFKSSKLSQIASYFLISANSFPFDMLFAHFAHKKKYGNDSFLIYICDFLPNFILTGLGLMRSNCFKYGTLKTIFCGASIGASESDKREYTRYCDQKITRVNNFITSFITYRPSPMFVSYLMVNMLILFYYSATILLLGFNLRPNVRYSLGY